jgi:hypothetical protein
MSCNKHEHLGERERIDTIQVFFPDLLQGAEKLHTEIRDVIGGTETNTYCQATVCRTCFLVVPRTSEWA